MKLHHITWNHIITFILLSLYSWFLRTTRDPLSALIFHLHLRIEWSAFFLSHPLDPLLKYNKDNRKSTAAAAAMTAVGAATAAFKRPILPLNYKEIFALYLLCVFTSLQGALWKLLRPWTAQILELSQCNNTIHYSTSTLSLQLTFSPSLSL